MLARTSGTYAKLNKVYTGTGAECWKLFKAAAEFSAMPLKDVVQCTRGNNSIFYWRPAGGRFLNEKIGMIHYNRDGSASLYL